jgi:hypothetical protein
METCPNSQDADTINNNFTLALTTSIMGQPTPKAKAKSKAAPAPTTAKATQKGRHTVRGLTRALLWPISTVLGYIHALLTSVLLTVLALGPMPHHVGFVMDGNRRYARSHGQRIAKGHQQGSESLKRVSEAASCGPRTKSWDLQSEPYDVGLC